MMKAENSSNTPLFCKTFLWLNALLDTNLFYVVWAEFIYVHIFYMAF